VPADRAGLVSAVNNTARQACGAIGIAVFGAVAGSPTTGHFLSGLHAEALVGAGLFAAAAIATFALIPPAQERFSAVRAPAARPGR
jgi:DHA2 family methylenomycin A resistance protein-like MFS transporter